jgi:hypothetical protein
VPLRAKILGLNRRARLTDSLRRLQIPAAAARRSRGSSGGPGGRITHASREGDPLNPRPARQIPHKNAVFRRMRGW